MSALYIPGSGYTVRDSSGRIVARGLSPVAAKALIDRGTHSATRAALLSVL